MKINTIIPLALAWIFLAALLGNPTLSQEIPILQAGDFTGEPAEEIILHTERDLYLAGEPVWFSACCNIRNSMDPSPLSQILYIELHNPSNKVFLREKVKLDSGRASGRIIIPEETPTGYYFIRAYTMYQRNFPPEYYLTTGITVVNPEIPQSELAIEKDIKILAEGGGLLSGTMTNLALRIPYRLMVKTNSVFLAEGTNATTQEIHIHPNGLGLISFIPTYPVDYFLKLFLTDGDSLMVPLPPVNETGLAVIAAPVPEGLEISIMAQGIDGIDLSRCKLKILDVAFSPRYEQDINMGKASQKITVPPRSLPDGLNYVLLTDQNDSVLRIDPFYFEKAPPGKVSLGLDRSDFTSREKVEIELNPERPSDGDITIMSVSVVKKGTFAGTGNMLSDQVIVNPFLLESQLMNIGERPPELMEQIKSATVLFSPAALDSYQRSLKDTTSGLFYIPEIRDISISGYLLNSKTKQPLINIPMYAAVLFGDFQLHTTQTQADGSFVFALNHLSGRKNIFISPDIDDNREHELLIHNDFSTQFREIADCSPIIDSTQMTLLEELFRNQSVSYAFHGTGQVLEEELQKFTPWFGVSMTTIKLADYINLTTFREVFNEIVPNVRLKVNNDQYRFTVFDDKSQIVYEEPMVLLDYIPVTDINALANIHPSQIEKIEVMNQPYLLGNYTIRGLINITTKTDNFAGVVLPEESAFLNYQTLTPKASFIPLDFDDQNLKSSPLPYFNTVLYWNTWAGTDRTPDNFSFFTSDQAGAYEVRVRGYNKKGEKVVGAASFIVTDE